MFFANRLQKIKESPTLALSALVNNLKAQGQDIIDFGVGEPSFNTPDFVKQGGIDAINKNMTRYTPVDGTLALKDAIIKKFQKDNNLTYNRKQITVGTGAKQVIFNAMMATVNAGDEVIVPTPYWVSYPDMVQVADGTPVFIECTQENNFKLKAEDLEKAITSKTKWLILNSPSNPTGMVYSEKELREIADVLLKHKNIWILTDDIYEHLIYDGKKFINILNVEPSLYDRTLVLNGVSKSHAMTGWRIGFAGGPEELIKNISKIQSHSTSNPSSISQEAARIALEGDMSFFDEWKEAYVRRRELAFSILSQSKYLNVIKPDGAFYIFANSLKTVGSKKSDGSLIKNDSDLCKYILEEGKVGVVPGSAFGLSNHFRISYVADDRIVEEGCRRIVEALNKLS
jgi:aspartate aminotransferase